MSSYIRASLLVLMCTSCGGAAVRPDDLSAEQHRREAARERLAARDHEEQFDPGQQRVVGIKAAEDGSSAPYAYPVTMYNPTEHHLRDAERHATHAAEHEAAAAALEEYEEQECRDFPPATRASCPLLHYVVAVEDIAGGVRVRFDASVNVAPIVAHMRCHLAYARTRGYREDEACALYLRHVVIVAGKDGASVEITSRDKTTAKRLRALVWEVIAPDVDPSI